MAYVPGCQVDVFLSYAHFDEDGDGWVSTLKDRLENKLAAYLGSRPVIWLDKRRLRGGDPILTEIQTKLKYTAVEV